MTSDVEPLLTGQGWRRLPSGNWTHPRLTPTSGSSSRARVVTTARAAEIAHQWIETELALLEAVETIIDETIAQLQGTPCTECGNTASACDCPASVRSTS